MSRLNPVLLAVLLLASFAWPQSPSSAPPGTAPAASRPSSSARPEPKRKEPRISQQQADELFRSVDEILKFVSKDSGLPIKEPVKRALATREQVESYVQQRMKDDKDTQRLQHSEVVLKKFGLLPRDFDLRKFLVDLMGEQVAGYYDTKTKTVYLLDWLDAAAQRPVLAHELTHALQDQNFDLEKWLNAPDKAKKNSDDDTDDESTARVAVTEGQAMMTLIDYMLDQSGRTIVLSPAIVAQFRNINPNSGDFPLLRSAPLLLQESLSFPYSYGLGFEYDLLLHGGRTQAFRGVFAHPPRSTRDIMEPEAYRRGEEIPALRLPDLKEAMGSGYRKYDEGAVGELDVYVILKQFNGDGEAQRMSSKWRGGAYLAATPGSLDAANAPQKGGKAAPESSVGPATLGLLYIARWAAPADAQRFANDYASALPKKYKELKLLSLPSDLAARTWSTEEGPVNIVMDGDRTFISEGFDQSTADRLRAKVLSQGEPTFATRH